MLDYGFFNMDCMEGMKRIPDGSVDMILTDPPYNTTQISWDKENDFSAIWTEFKRVSKPNAAIVIFSAQPFTTDLINSNRKMFKYEIIWKKTLPSGFLNAHKMPLRCHENILVFYQKLPTYNPIMRKAEQKNLKSIGRKRLNSGKAEQYGEFRRDDWEWTESGERFPVDVIEMSNWNGALFGDTKNATIHPTQKPVNILEYLIKTYTNEKELVLDAFAGSGSTAIASYNTNRRFIGFEKDVEIYRKAKERIERETAQMNIYSIIGNL